MISLTSTQFNPFSYITKISAPKKIIFLLDTNQVSTFNGHSLKPVPPLEYDHLLAHMWDMDPDSLVTVLPTDVNMYGKG